MQKKKRQKLSDTVLVALIAATSSIVTALVGKESDPQILGVIGLMVIVLLSLLLVRK